MGEPEAKRQRKDDLRHLRRPGQNLDGASIAFMQVDCDYCTERLWQDQTRNLNKNLTKWHKDDEYPIVRIYGVTADGASVHARVHGFQPYFYAMASGSVIDARNLRKSLEEVLSASNNGKKNCVLDVELVRRKTFMFFQDKDEDCFRITVSLPKMVAESRRILEGGVTIQNAGMVAFELFEANVPYALRYMVDRGIPGGGWCEVPPGKFFARPADKRTSTCTIEIDVHCDDVVAHPADGEWMKLAPIRILSFDIECMSLRGQGFPTADRNEIIQIAACVGVLGQSEYLSKAVWTLKSCAPIPGVHVMSFEDEAELLNSFRDFIEIVDPDFISGYNIINFDLPYLIERAEHLGAHDFAKLGRLEGQRAKIKESHFESKQQGKRETKEINIEGRVQLDMFVVVQRDHKLRSYSLNAVAANFLGDQKEDVHYSIIGDLQRGDEHTRKRLAVYCMKDAILPMQLIDKLLVMYNTIEMARVTGVPINFLLTRGQMIKVMSMIYKYCREEGYIVPVKRPGTPEDTFEGATVLEPVCGFYKDPVATLDFASLYPSIMMAHNLCYTTLAKHGSGGSSIEHLPADEVTVSPNGHRFVKHSTRKGLLPRILNELLGARKRAKKDMKEAKDPLTKSVLNGRQLALKVSANSVYGFTGATVGALPCLEISSSVTSFGRQMIDQTKKYVEDNYTVAKGYEHDAVVVYGDTDSVFVKFGTDNVAESMRLGEEAAAAVSKIFISPVKLEFEKVYFPFLLMNKKRYAGLYWTNSTKWDKLDTTGIETVRRDNCQLASDVLDTCLKHILIDQSIDQAVAYVQRVISDLLQNKVDLSLLVVSKQLAKEHYDVRLPHTELAEKMRKRDPGTAPVLGDRVPYVIIRGSKGAKAYERAEDPLYVLDQECSVDPDYYIDQQLKQPVLRLFENVLEDAEKQIFKGDHTRKVVNKAVLTGGLAAFVQKGLQCLGCKVTIKAGGLCGTCKKSKETSVVAERLSALRLKEEEYGKLWSQCQRCQSSMHQDILCSSRDCPIFYRRTKAKKELTSAEKDFARLRECCDW
jgi:DNA polymerase delta subunit 1